jgi:hypothetical protein
MFGELQESIRSRYFQNRSVIPPRIVKRLMRESTASPRCLQKIAEEAASVVESSWLVLVSTWPKTKLVIQLYDNELHLLFDIPSNLTRSFLKRRCSLTMRAIVLVSEGPVLKNSGTYGICQGRYNQ